MLMLDVRNAIARILDRYSLADIVEVTLRRMRRDKVSPIFGARRFDLHNLLEASPIRPRRARRRAGQGRIQGGIRAAR
jgi:hypothetical protein